MKAKLKGVTVYFSPTEYQQLKAEAKLYRRTLSSFIREYHCGLPGMRRGAPPKPASESAQQQRRTRRNAARKPSANEAAERRRETLFELN